ncbi:MAG TPA: ABC transporter substrate-binding protein [Candidatus Binatia bacterium]|nr:ABC transporter substrate-binding protein [Candidatus Binatia bacterium]
MSRWPAVISLVLALVAPVAARTRPRYGGTLRIETRSDPLAPPDGIARRLLFDTLTQVNDRGEVLPALASSWESQGANHRWQFHVRGGVHFHDGRPLTAEAVVQSLAAACNHCAWHVRAVGDSVIVTSDSPMPGLPAELARSAYAITRRDENGNPDGTGPFRSAANSNGILFLSANDDSWQGRPFVDAIEIYTNRSVREQWLDFSIGKADLVEVPPEFLRQAQQERLPLAVSAYPSDLLALTISDQHVRDEHLRESMALAPDRAALFNVIFQKQGEITASLLPDELSGYAFLFPGAANLARSRELRGGQSIPLRLIVERSGSALQLVAERLALNLRDAGWNVRVVPQTGNSDAELALRMVHVEASDAASALRELMANFGAASRDDGSDPSALYRIERTFLQSHTVVPLLYLPRAWGVSGRVRNLALSPDGTPLLANVSLEDAK